MSAYATAPLVSKKILDDHDNGVTVKSVKIHSKCLYTLGQNLYPFEEKFANFPLINKTF